MSQNAARKTKTKTAQPSLSIITTTTSTATTTSPSLSSFPDAVSTYLSSFLSHRERRRLRETSSRLLEAYGGKMTTLKLHWHSYIPSSSTALFGLLARQERLKWLILKSTSLFPSLLISISHGHCRYLKSLRLVSKRRIKPALEISQLMALAALMAAGDLPNLERLELHVKWVEGALAVLVDGLRNGACPKLEFLGQFSRNNLHRDGRDENLEALTKLIESRQDLPGCLPSKSCLETGLILPRMKYVSAFCEPSYRSQ